MICKYYLTSNAAHNTAFFAFLAGLALRILFSLQMQIGGHQVSEVAFIFHTILLLKLPVT